MQGLPSADSESHQGARKLNIFNRTYSQPSYAWGLQRLQSCVQLYYNMTGVGFLLSSQRP